MRHEFDPNHNLVIVPAELTGPNGVASLKLVLDTGATTTLVRPVHLEWLGYNLQSGVRRVRMTTGSAVESVPQLPVMKISALGRRLEHFMVVAHALPITAPIDGLLGLDFFRGTTLELDFQNGVVSLTF